MKPLTPDETLLGLIATQPQHGYQLMEFFHNPSELGMVWRLSTSQLYAVLKRLQKQRLIIGHQVERTDAPPRTEYTLSDDGKKHLMTWLSTKRPSPSVQCVRVEFLSRLYIARLLNIPTLEIVKQQKKACQQRYQELLEERNRIPPGISFLTLELVIAQLNAILGWIDRCELVPLEMLDKD